MSSTIVVDMALKIDRIDIHVDDNGMDAVDPQRGVSHNVARVCLEPSYGPSCVCTPDSFVPEPARAIASAHTCVLEIERVRYGIERVARMHYVGARARCLYANSDKAIAAPGAHHCTLCRLAPELCASPARLFLALYRWMFSRS
jgi:hypothetical protein